jgi:hypothetical protein
MKIRSLLTSICGYFLDTRAVLSLESMARVALLIPRHHARLRPEHLPGKLGHKLDYPHLFLGVDHAVKRRRTVVGPKKGGPEH